MIRDDGELKAALEWLGYWNQNRSGEQSWIGNEQARKRVLELRGEIDDYRKRTGRSIVVEGPSPTPQEQPEAVTRSVNRVLSPFERDASDTR
jgi:hypothetical protein